MWCETCVIILEAQLVTNDKNSIHFVGKIETVDSEMGKVCVTEIVKKNFAHSSKATDFSGAEKYRFSIFIIYSQ